MFLQENWDFFWESRRHEENTRLLPKGAAVLALNRNRMFWPQRSECIIRSTGRCLLVPVSLLSSLTLEHCTEEKVRTHPWFSPVCFRERSKGNNAVPLFIQTHEEVHSVI